MGCTGVAISNEIFLQVNKTLDLLKSAKKPNMNVTEAARMPGKVREGGWSRAEEIPRMVRN